MTKGPHLSVVVALLCACSSDTSPGAPAVDAAPADAGEAQDAAGMVPDAGGSTDAAGDPWAEVARIAEAAFTRQAFPGLGVVIRDAQDRTVFARTYGDFALDRAIAVASASKLVSGTVLLELVRRGSLRLDDTTGKVLGWPAGKDAISLRHLMSFTSGLKPEAACTLATSTTLAACADEIRDAQVLAPPGTRFDYGGTHLHVAGRMAEVATGKSWKQLFDEVLARPLAVAADTRYVTLPRQGLGQQNPLIAGGLRITTLDYAEILALYFHKGRYRGLDVGTPELFDEAAREPYPTVDVKTVPPASMGRSLRYGLASWLHCSAPADGCAVVSSPGAFGFTPWVDRNAGYYAIIAMELGNAAGGTVGASLDLQEELAPAIRAALGRRSAGFTSAREAPM